MRPARVRARAVRCGSERSFEPAPCANSGDGSRLEDDHEGVSEAGQLAAQLACNPRGRQAFVGAFLERRQGEENRTGIRCVRECRAVETNKCGRVQDGRVLENFGADLADDFIGAIERGARRKLDRRDQVASV